MPVTPPSPWKAASTWRTTRGIRFALRRQGFRPSQRYIVFQVLPHTLGLGPEVWRVLDKCHHQRNIAEYEGELEVSERLILDLIAACDAVRSAMWPAD